MLLPATEPHDAPVARYTLCFVLQGEVRLCYRLDDRLHTHWMHPSMFAPIMPPHVKATLQPSGEQQHLMISIEVVTVARVAAESGNGEDELETLRLRAFKDSFLGELCRRAWAETRRGDPLGRSFADLIKGTLICQAELGASRSREVAPGMAAGRAIQRVLDFGAWRTNGGMPRTRRRRL